MPHTCCFGGARSHFDEYLNECFDGADEGGPDAYLSFEPQGLTCEGPSGILQDPDEFCLPGLLFFKSLCEYETVTLQHSFDSFF